jgi:hypothetical protein
MHIKREKRRDSMSQIKGRTLRRTAILWATVLAMLLSYNLAVFANDSPDTDYETDSSHILVSEADTSVEDIAELVEGEAPSEVLGDKTLQGYSTLAVFSVTAIDDYDFSTLETTNIKGATITDTMEIQVRFLPDEGSWKKIDYTVTNGIMSVQFESEGHLAIFAKDQVEEAQAEDTYKKSPQTGDYLPLYILAGLAAAGALAFSVRKLIKR